MRIALALLLLASPCYAVEKLETDGVARATIISQDNAEITPESGTVVISANGEIENIIF